MGSYISVVINDMYDGRLKSDRYRVGEAGFYHISCLGYPHLCSTRFTQLSTIFQSILSLHSSSKSYPMYVFSTRFPVLCRLLTQT